MDLISWFLSFGSGWYPKVSAGDPVLSTCAAGLAGEDGAPGRQTVPTLFDLHLEQVQQVDDADAIHRRAGRKLEARDGVPA